MPANPQASISAPQGKLLFVAASLVGLALMLMLPQARAQADGKGNGNFATDGRVWGALLYATNEPLKPGETNADKKLTARAFKAFKSSGTFKNFKNFKILGQKTSPLYKELDSWVDPSPDMLIKLDSKGPAKGGGIKLDLKLWLKKKVVLKTTTVLKSGTPLFITGPKWGKGRLLMVVELK